MPRDEDYDPMDPLDNGEADRAYERDREDRAVQRRPKWGDSCTRCDGFGRDYDGEGNLVICTGCEGTGFAKHQTNRAAPAAHQKGA